MSTTLDQQLQARIEAFANDITAILTRAVAESVRDTLNVKGAAKAGKAAGRRRRAGAAIDPEVLLREVRRRGGRRMEELCKALRTDTPSIRPSMGQLIAAKKVKTTGQARGTKYHAS